MNVNNKSVVLNSPVPDNITSEPDSNNLIWKSEPDTAEGVTVGVGVTVLVGVGVTVLVGVGVTVGNVGQQTGEDCNTISAGNVYAPV